MMKLSAASALVAASAAAAVIGLGAPAFATTGAVAHTTKPTCLTVCGDYVGGPDIGVGPNLGIGPDFGRFDFNPYRFRHHRHFFGFEGESFFNDGPCYPFAI